MGIGKAPFMGALLFCGSTLVTPALGRNASPSIAGQKRSGAVAKKSEGRATAQTFTGMVEWEYKPLSWDCDVPNCDHFALYDDAAKMNYEIDDARAALPFEGRRAKISGILNPETDTIHLLSIEALK